MTRIKITFDWDEVIEKMEAGCTAKEIVGGSCDMNLFYMRFKERFGVSFSEVRRLYVEKGNGVIRHKQYVLAKNGSIKMLELLGVERLGQKRNVTIAPPNDEIISLRHENIMMKNELMKMNGGKIPEELDSVLQKGLNKEAEEEHDY